MGRYVREATPDGITRRALISDSLTPNQQVAVLRHEVGHTVDDVAGEFVGLQRTNAIPQGGIKRELGALYNAFRSATSRAAPPLSESMTTAVRTTARPI